MGNAKYFFLNGQKYCTSANFTLFDLVTYFDYNTSLLVVEHNSLISKKETWETIWINHKDKIEIISIVGGG